MSAIPTTHSVYAAMNDPGRPYVMNRIASELTRRQATQMATALRVKRGSTKTVVFVYSGNNLRSAL